MFLQKLVALSPPNSKIYFLIQSLHYRHEYWCWPITYIFDWIAENSLWLHKRFKYPLPDAHRVPWLFPLLFWFCSIVLFLFLLLLLAALKALINQKKLLFAYSPTHCVCLLAYVYVCVCVWCVYKSQSMSFANTNTIEHVHVLQRHVSLLRASKKYAKENALKKFD